MSLTRRTSRAVGLRGALDRLEALNTRTSGARPREAHATGMADRFPPDAETVVFFRDGTAWLAVRLDWEDVQSSPTGTGATRAEAFDDLLREEARAKPLARDAG